MKATEANFLEFLKQSPQFVIPIYQRTYSWTERECRQLWEDILRTGSNDAIAAHFTGSIVYIEKGIYQVSTHSPLLCNRRSAASHDRDAYPRSPGEARG